MAAVAVAMGVDGEMDEKGTKMKVVATSKDGLMESELDPHFGRAPKFILFDTVTGKASVHDNTQNLNAAQGAGIQSAETVVRLGGEAVITGNVGPKAFRALNASGVRILLAPAGRTVRETIEALGKGELQEAAAATKEGHWM